MYGGTAEWSADISSRAALRRCRWLLQVVDAGDLYRVSDTDVLAEVRGLEVLRRRLVVADHALIGELDRRGLAGRLVMSSTEAVLQGLLRLSRGEAKDRVTAAPGRAALGPR